MLVLSRREGERIAIGDGITITVVRVEPQGVRIGIEAPAEIPVWRQELLVAGQVRGGRSARGSQDAERAT